MNVTLKTPLIAAPPNAEIMVSRRRFLFMPLIMNVTFKTSLIAALPNAEIVVSRHRLVSLNVTFKNTSHRCLL